MDTPTRDDPPQRLSAMYQYHNAPEVAPAHGLEYDDTIYPSSDKYPVIREREYDNGGKYGFNGDNRPPRIIFGMKIRTFLMVAAVMTLIIVGAAVGGAVGGQQLRENQAAGNFYPNGSFPVSMTTGTASPTTAHTTFSAPTPTFTALSDCPDSNNTKFSSQYSDTQGTSRSNSKKAGLKFTKYCDKQNPLMTNTVQHIAEAFVYTFSDCVEVCAGYNYWNNNANCTVAVYQPNGTRPGNCWVGHAGNADASQLGDVTGIEVALLNA